VSNQNFGGARPVRHLTTDEMVEAAQVFTEAYHHVLANTGLETRARIIEFVGHVVLAEKPYILVTPEGLDHAIGLVFENKYVVDFVHTLLFTFGSRWGMSQEKYEGLAANLAAGAAPISLAPASLRSTPDALASRLASFPDAYSLLVANQWLVILLLLQAFVSATLQQAPNKPK
jgi:hypothetical protein